MSSSVLPLSGVYSAESVESLYCDHHSWLQRWLHHRLGGADQAADLAQDTFVRLLSSRSRWQFASPGEARAYLRKTAQNLCINLWRRQEIEQAWLDILATTPENFYPSAERQAMILQALEEISAMLSSLSPKAAKAFTLAVICEMTDDEVGAEMGISGRMVRKYVAQAMLGCISLHACRTVAELRQEPQY
ncbi:sigma-70 family RNA polymerase sigma factor [Alcaligenes faecalis]|uniref:sigma-70 family RNA polymerase sigma factor n=1 Tax=Alcaligenes faecalis TaxID=511 RepID=UPI000E1781E5|nr:sigma-70 family RNA polymerase sigma factor [Alcaligenes faecalis]SSY79924.1 Probable RNA polymerase sigma factor fecI [Alcaligenes faecalis subsp. faecalis]